LLKSHDIKALLNDESDNCALQGLAAIIEMAIVGNANENSGFGFHALL
jgi:hypothetical protein